MPAWLVPAAISGLSALSGLFGGKPKTKTTEMWGEKEEDTQGWGNRWEQGEETPTYDSTTLGVRNYILRELMSRIGSQPNLNQYEGQGFRDINANSNAALQTMRNNLAARGLSFSPVAATAPMAVESQRLGEMMKFSSQIPLLQRQFQVEDLNNLGNFFKALPVGRTTSGYTGTTQGQVSRSSTHGKETSQTSGDQLAQILAGLGSGIASTWGYNWAKGKGKGGSSGDPWNVSGGY